MMERILSGQTAIVTGASRNRGIGAAVCRSLADAGANIFFTAWRPYDSAAPHVEEIDFPDLLQELEQCGVQAESMEIDLSRPTAPAKLMNEVSRRFEMAHILINNACHSIGDNFRSINADNLDQHYAVNVRGPILLSAEFVRRYSARGARRIISMTSGQSAGPMPGELSYAATKGSIEAFTLTFAAEIAHLGITVNAVDPGPVNTGWMSDSDRRNLIDRFPFGRVGEPEDAAKVIRFLASSEADWITGEIIRARGGFR
jgi:3-oxoacyl-[acyl-carrier protein] reductase